MSKIGWTEKTWNPIVGCSHASPGCDNCYAERMADRLVGIEAVSYKPLPLPYTSVIKAGKWNGKTFFVESALSKPLHWRKPRHIFVCSMSDLFHPSVPFEWIAQVYAVAAICQQHTFQILTKRIERALEFYEWLKPQWLTMFPGGANHPHAGLDMMDSNVVLQFSKLDPDIVCGEHDAPAWPLPNVWLGVTAENQEMADKRIPILLQTPAAKRFVSVEPMLEAVDLNETSIGQAIGPCDECGKYKGNCDCCMGIPSLDWVICGGESGPGARPMHPDWARGLRETCKAADVSFFFKQWGAWMPCDYKTATKGKQRFAMHNGKEVYTGVAAGLNHIQNFKRIGKKKAGCLLDGVEHKEFPEAGR